ncbi:hypothetical protein 2 [Beihai sobemo-like virus 7]|uniref:hypothetical protein 2 n=1 Tax=Beihai sobemo-like virus 7 TaxID=1922704 RepID=UPI000909565F|nr:hypothetical protein 2 [Beihai sobemo-like virus 7]APG75702.1 hypothetical protein 2 [Beihai sobemo-like virus 7]
MARLPVRRKIVKRKTNGRRSTADKVQAQGTGKAVRVAFGNGNGKRNGKLSIPRLPSGCWDAFCQSHAALPRAVGPYTIVRTTRLIKTTSRWAMVGTFARFGGVAGPADGVPLWTNICCATEDGAGAIGGTAATRFYGIPLPVADTLAGPSGSGTLCPAAISVQVMANQNLQQATGQLAAAVVPVRMDMRGTTRTWSDIESQFVSYFRPRLMSAGKLVLRGVQMDSHPLSMADVSQFRGAHEVTAALNTDGVTPAAWSLANAPYDTNGWAPMVIYNPDNASLSLLITIEWRVRFDLSNPAVSSHTHHGVSSDVSWEKHIAAATRQLPGVLDIVEKVASTGMAVASMVRG